MEREAESANSNFSLIGPMDLVVDSKATTEWTAGRWVQARIVRERTTASQALVVFVVAVVVVVVAPRVSLEMKVVS